MLPNQILAEGRPGFSDIAREMVGDKELDQRSKVIKYQGWGILAKWT